MTEERNPVNRRKLPGSKWTAARPQQRQKHFTVVDWVRDDDGEPTEMIEIEAILTNTVQVVHWRELESRERWHIGWR